MVRSFYNYLSSLKVPDVIDDPFGFVCKHLTRIDWADPRINGHYVWGFLDKVRITLKKYASSFPNEIQLELLVMLMKLGLPHKPPLTSLFRSRG